MQVVSIARKFSHAQVHTLNRSLKTLKLAKSPLPPSLATAPIPCPPPSTPHLSHPDASVTAAPHNGDEGRSARPRVKRRFEEGPPVLSAASTAARAGSPGLLHPAPAGGGADPPGIGAAAYGDDDDGEEAEAAARRAAEHQEEQLVMSAWGKRYKAGHAPKSSHVGNLLPEDDLRKYTTLLPWNKAAAAAAPAIAADGAAAAAAAAAEAGGGGAGGAAIDASNIGHRLLSKMGWSAGKGLGASESGAVAPVAALKGAADRTGVTAGDMSGLGAQVPSPLASSAAPGILSEAPA